MKKQSLTNTVPLLLLALSGCASSPPTVLPVAVTCPKPPAVSAQWMTPPSNSPQLVDKLFSISAKP